LQSYALGLGGANTGALAAAGTTAAGGGATIAWSAQPPSARGLLVLSLGRAAVTYPQGVLVVDPGSLLALASVTTDSAGTGLLPIPIPTAPPLVGLRVAFQGLFGDPLVFTNGVDLVVCP
ncbi:MAG: hypothetical protein ACK5BN_06490, partial [Planctomycetota bacterium]